MNWWWKKKDKPTLKFKSIKGDFSAATPVVPASRIKPAWLRSQMDSGTSSKFQRCPGMLDYANAGYIITAHVDIHIKANKAGVAIRLDTNAPYDSEGYFAPRPFDYKMVEGMAPIDDSVIKYAGKIPLPWTVQAEEGISGYCIPAVMHSSYLDKIFVYPGVVDYDNFHTVNFVFSPLKECEFVIPAGTPLLQIFPFRREDTLAVCGRATQMEEEKHLFNIPSKISHYYRKFLSRKKVYKLECPYEHRELGRSRQE